MPKDEGNAETGGTGESFPPRIPRLRVWALPGRTWVRIKNHTQHHVLEFDFKYAGLGPATMAFGDMSGIGRGGTGVLKVDGKEVATRQIPYSMPVIMNFDEMFDVGIDTRTGVDDKDYKVPFRFNGKIEKLTFKLGPPQITAADQKKAAQMNVKARD